MTEDITSLQIRILYDSVTEAERKLKLLEATGNRTGPALKKQQSAINSTLGSIGRLAAAYVSARGAIAGFQAIIRKTAEFQQLNAQLVTATGSAEGASKAFAAIKRFAATTPFDLQQATGAFISLVNRGLTPSERALKSYGDTASSMGFQLSEMVLAVSNATAGEFENLKRFGIRAQKEGENVKFTFRGVTTTVRNNINEIERYFIELGEKNFGGGMTRQMDTLTGAFSNLGDAWEVMLATIGEKGLGDVVEDMTRRATTAISDFTSYMESGQLDVELQRQAGQWSALGETIMSAVHDANQAFSELVDDAATDSNEWEDYWKDVFTNFPANVNTAVQLSISYLQYFVRKSGEFAGEVSDMFSDIAKGVKVTIDAQGNFNRGMSTDEAWKKALKDNGLDTPPGEALPSPNGYIDLDANGNAVWKGETDIGPGVLPPKDPTAEEDLQSQIDAAIQQNDALKNQNAEYDNKKRLLGDIRDLERELDANADPHKPDALAGFRVGGDPTGTGDASGAGGAKKGGRTVAAEFEAEMLKSIYEKEALNDLDRLTQEENHVRASYEKRMAEILRLSGLTEQQKLALMTKAEAEYATAQEDFQRKRQESQLKLAGDFFGNLSSIAGAFGARGAKIAKAAAIVQTTIDTYRSATAAYASLAGIPYVGPVLGAAAAGAAIAAGLANVQRIKSQDDSGGYAGAYAQGGIVGGQSFTGDNLTARVNSGEMVLNRGQQKRLFDVAEGRSGSGGGVKVIVNNLPGQGADVKTSANGDLVEIAITRTLDVLTAEAHNGGGRFVPALQRRFNLKRQG